MKKTKPTTTHSKRCAERRRRSVSKSKPASNSRTLAAPTQVDLCTIIIFVFMRLARQGVMSFSEAASLLEELAKMQNITDTTRIYLYLIIIALSKLDMDFTHERFYFH
jgi:hypothetical protein